MAAATVRSSTTGKANAAQTTGVTVNKPTGLATGDILYIWYMAEQSNATPWTLSGFTNLGHDNLGTGNNRSFGLLRKVITNGAGEPSTYTPVGSATGVADMAAIAVCVQNGDTANPENIVSAITLGSNDFTPAATSAVATVENTLALTVHGASCSSGTGPKTAGAPATCTLVDSIESNDAPPGVFVFLEVARLAHASGTFNPGSWTGTADDATSETALMTVLVNNAPPVVALNTPADAGTVTTTTPQLAFTGTDLTGDDIRYNVRLHSPAIDSYGFENGDQGWNGYLIYDSTHVGFGQSFTGDGQDAAAVVFNIVRAGTPGGDITAKLYAHTGTFGTNGVPTGAALATSAAVAASTISTTGGPVLFAFTTPYTTVNGTKYFVTLEYSGTAGSIGNSIKPDRDLVGATHAGNEAQYNGTSWGVAAAVDTPFYVLAGTTYLDKVSGTDSGFDDITTPADTDPFETGDQVGYTTPTLVDGETYSWTVRGIDPNGGNVYGAFPTARTFSVNVPVSAVGTLSGGGTLAASSTVTHLATASVAGGGVLAASATVETPGGGTVEAVGALAGGGTLGAAAVVTHPATAVLTGGGVLAGTSTVTHVAVAALSGGGTLAATATVTRSATATLAGGGVLAAVGTRTVVVTATFAGGGVLVTTATVTHPAVAVLDGGGVLAGVATPTVFAVLVLSGGGVLAAIAGTVTLADGIRYETATFYNDQRATYVNDQRATFRTNSRVTIGAP